MRIVTLSIALAAVLSTAAAAAQQQAPDGNADRGKAAFLRVGCYTCHGYEGQGVPGKKIAPNPLAWPAFSSFVRTSPGEMPTFTSAILPDQDLADIYA